MPYRLRQEFQVFLERDVLRISQMDACQIMAMPYFRYQAQTSKKGQELEPSIPRCILMRLLAKHPALAPLPTKVTPMDGLDRIHRLVPGMSFSDAEFAAVLGLEATAVFRYRRDSGTKMKSIAQRLLQVILQGLAAPELSTADRKRFLSEILALAQIEGESRGIQASVLFSRGFCRPDDDGTRSAFVPDLEAYQAQGKGLSELVEDGLAAARAPQLLTNSYLSFVEKYRLRVTEQQMSYLIQLPYMRYKTATSAITEHAGAYHPINVPGRAILSRILALYPTCNPSVPDPRPDDFFDRITRLPGLGNFSLASFSTLLGLDISTASRYLNGQRQNPIRAVKQIMLSLNKAINDPGYGDGPAAVIKDALELAQLEGVARGLTLQSMAARGFSGHKKLVGNVPPTDMPPRYARPKTNAGKRAVVHASPSQALKAN